MAGLPHRADDLLQGVDVLVPEDWADDFAALLAALKLPSGSARQTRPARSGGAALKKKIVVVDNSPIILDAVRDALEDDFDVVTLDNPLLLPRVVRVERPDLILLDANMPTINGENVAKRSGVANWIRKSTPMVELCRRLTELLAAGR